MDVEWSHRFRLYTIWLRRHADTHPHGAHAQILRGLERVSAEVVGDATKCFDPQYALRAPLDGVYRYKLGRGRLFYIASSERKMAIVLHFGDTRREGDKQRDAYAEFSRLVRSTEFDRLFAKLGITKPKAKD